jgi:hypothetical protein
VPPVVDAAVSAMMMVAGRRPESVGGRSEKTGREGERGRAS